MTCLVVIEFRVKEGNGDALYAWLRRILPDTRDKPGCGTVSVTRNQDNPLNYIFVEQWATRQDYENYFKWRGDTGILDELADLIDGEASFRFFDYVGL